MAYLYDQKINLVELTKLLERDTCDTLSFTYPIGHDFVAGAIAVKFLEKKEPTDATESKLVFNQDGANNMYFSPSAKKETIKIYNLQLRKLNFPPYDNMETSIIIEAPNGVQEVIGVVNGETGTLWGEYKISLDGEYKIIYKAWTGEYYAPMPTIKVFSLVEFSFKSVDNITPKPIPSITDVVNRILSVGLVRKENEPQKYTLDPVFAEKYSNVDAPEFFITRCTLFEALLQIGGYIHAIPRLDWNEVTDDADIITFDELGSSDEYVPPKEYSLIGYQCETNADEYCGTIDSYVDNIVNTLSPQEGSIVKPCEDGYMTVRTEEGQMIIEDSSVVISTEFPIYRITKLEMGYLIDDKLVGDITPYVYEQAEYDALTGYKGSFPYAKEFAVCYKQGDNKITGLTLKADTVTSLGVAFTKFAARNIAERKLSLQEEKSKGTSADITSMCNFAFRITYLPIVSARVKQRKPYKTHPFDNTLFYQQGANMVESDYYGEHLKGQIAKIGNQVELKTIRFRQLTDLPKVGQLWEGKYISQVDIEYERHFIKATIYLTPNFNRLSQYIGINSNYRLYDVSEKQSIKRDINYSENIFIGDAESSKTSLTADGIKAFAGEFLNNTQSGGVSFAIAQGKSQDKQLLLETTMNACVSLAMGNSLMFVWKFDDNYSAGKKAELFDGSKKIQKYVPYGDNYGSMYYLGFVLKSGLGRTFSYGDQYANGFCDKLPQIDSVYLSGSSLIDFNTIPLIVQKDSREALEITTQLHFIANRQSIVLGHELAHKNPLVSGQAIAEEKQLVFLTYTLNMLQAIVDMSKANVVMDGVGIVSLISVSGRTMTIGAVTNGTANIYKSWAIINPKNRKLYIGENINLTAGASTKEIIFNF